MRRQQGKSHTVWKSHVCLQIKHLNTINVPSVVDSTRENNLNTHTYKHKYIIVHIVGT